MEDARSVHSLADDFFLPPGASRGHMQASKTISRSTDKSLDSLGLEEEERLQGLASGNLRSDEILATMLKREPPDGKEKPEPPKHQKLETLSRKNSKCDLLENGGGGGQQQQGPLGNSCGSGPDSASLLSGSSAGTCVSCRPSCSPFNFAGHSLALLTQPHTPLSKTDSTSSKRDSFSAVSKEQTYLDSSGILLGGEEETISERLKDW